MSYYIVPLILLCIALYLLYRNNNKPGDKQKENMSREKAAAVIEKLAELGYFKYAEPGDIDSLKEDLVSSFSSRILSTLYDVKTNIPKDFRYYTFDGEEVFEDGGFTSMINDMKGTFDKIGLKLEITNHIEKADTHSLDHELTVNGKR